MWTNCTGISVATGMATAVGTLGSQAFGAQKFERVGIVTLRGACFLTIVAVIPLSALWWFAGMLMSTNTALVSGAIHAPCAWYRRVTEILGPGKRNSGLGRSIHPLFADRIMAGRDVRSTKAILANRE